MGLARFETTAYQTVSTPLSAADEQTTLDTTVPTPPPPDQLISDIAWTSLG